jgi:hypothetical protein
MKNSSNLKNNHRESKAREMKPREHQTSHETCETNQKELSLETKSSQP